MKNKKDIKDIEVHDPIDYSKIYSSLDLSSKSLTTSIGYMSPIIKMKTWLFAKIPRWFKTVRKTSTSVAERTGYGVTTRLVDIAIQEYFIRGYTYLYTKNSDILEDLEAVERFNLRMLSEHPNDAFKYTCMLSVYETGELCFKIEKVV